MNAQAGGTYLYAVLAGAKGAGELGRIGIDGGEIYCVTAGELTAAVSRVGRARLRPERKHVLAHQAVLRRLMEHGTVLPAAFGLVAPSDEAVRGRLVESREGFVEQLERVAEMALRVSWTVPDLVEHLVTVHPTLRAARERLRGRADASREELIAVGKLFEEVREADRRLHSERVAAALGPCVAELKWNPPRGEREVMGVSCLVPRSGLEAFGKALQAAAAAFDDHFVFQLNGPWAPYSFTELKTQEV
jgi:hypothetical protein